MNEWPTGWFREDKPAAPQDGNATPDSAAAGRAAAGSAAAGSAATASAAAGSAAASGMPGAANDPTVRLPARSGAGGTSYSTSETSGLPMIRLALNATS